MKITFEKITEKEISAVLEMMTEFNAIDDYPFEKDKTEKNLSYFITNSSLGRAWTINADEVIAGYLILTFGFSFEHNGRDAFIDELFLKTKFRQMGIGKKTMDFIETEAVRLGVNVVHLEVEPHNTDGTKLYREKGYKDNGRVLLSKKILKNTIANY
ncbi:MAG: GNAT family N-acetyltransferase [Flavobacteriaceae bacterium]